MTRRFRFGVSQASAASSDEWLATARRTEALGYSTLLVWDRVMRQFGPVAALTAAALATTRLRVGSYVFANDFHHPVVLAREAATIDVLSGGRFELGMGAGFVPAEYRAAGIPFDKAGIRVERLAEAVRIIGACFAGAPFSHEGRHYRIEDHRGWPLPVQRPRPPLLLAGARPRLLALAAREADIVGIAAGHDAGGLRVDYSAEATADKVRLIREAAAERFGALELQITIYALVDSDPQAAAHKIAGASGLDAGAVLSSPHYLLGSTEQIVETLRERRERFGISYVVLSSAADMERFAPVVERLAGT